MERHQIVYHIGAGDNSDLYKALEKAGFKIDSENDVGRKGIWKGHLKGYIEVNQSCLYAFCSHNDLIKFMDNYPK